MTLSDSEKDALREIFKSSGFRFFGQGKYSFKGNIKTASFNSFLKNLGFPETLRKYPALSNMAIAWFAKEFPSYHSAFNEVVAEWSENNREVVSLATAETSEEDEALAEDASAFIRSLIPTINLSKSASVKDQLILLDPHKDYRPVLDINPEIYLTLTERNVPAMILDEDVKKVMVTFDPYTLKSLFVKETKTGSLTTWHVNYYIPPRWRFVDAPPAFEGFIKTLIDHLFPNEDEKEFVLDWLHHAIVFRNDTVLCLIGARGTGKGILLKDILGGLIGEDYREIVNQEILTDKFNAAFKNKRFIFFDEVNVSGERELNKFKAFCNDSIALEEKGQDSETIDNYTSLGLSSNDKKDFRAEPQERRFSVPEVTEAPLLTVVSEQEVEEFCERIKKPDSVELAAFGNYLLQRKPKNTARKPLKGRYFFDLCKLSMPEWKTYIIDFIINEGEIGTPILNSTMVKKFKKIHGEHAAFATKRGSIETFLGDYYHEGVSRIGKVIEAWDAQRARDTFAIMPDEDFLRRFGRNYRNTDNDVTSMEDAMDAL